jgi:rSAM/selenodomain-associated transferase 2/rSAM/selenodomain-associated transferase 1
MAADLVFCSSHLKYQWKFTATEKLASSEHLIVFTRYPEPGKTKTRLIPVLGAEGAAALQRQMTEHTLAQVRTLSESVSVEIRFAGGDRASMQHWLGSNLDYQPQGNGDLGARIARAFQAAFAQGAERVMTIGTDCPELDANCLQHAFALLHQHDLVLGPATDGGYYLIGLGRFIPALFDQIRWGTADVLQQTTAIAEGLGMAVAYLDPLSDIDRPDDLPVWEKAKTKTQSLLEENHEYPSIKPEKISVIIPVLNEAATLGELLGDLRQVSGVEILVVDGGSQDQTIEIAESLGVKVLISEPGRARQMNAGAKVATGGILLFLHADTRLPQQFDVLVRQTLVQSNVVAGAFELKINGSQSGLRLIEWGVKWRSRLCQLPYGDQAIFLNTKVFKELDGFLDLPIMEDFEFVQRLQARGRIAIIPVAVLTSGRRWRRLGIWRTTLINQLVIAAYFLGVPPAQLAQWYRGSSAK